jgi:LacI family transcriptional regulator
VSTTRQPRARKAAPSMNDVASLAGVALGTVSNVLNNPEKVSVETLKRVQAAIDELGFVRNRAARSLAAGTSSTIGFVLVDLSNSFFVDMARGAEEVAEENSMSVLLANSDVLESKQKRYLNLFDEERVAGILLAPIPGHPDGIQRVRNHGRDVVLLNDSTPSNDICSVVVNNEHGGYLAARHLIDTGRRRLLFAGSIESLVPVVDRLRGAQKAVSETNGAVTLEIISTPEVRAEHGRIVGQEIRDRRAADRPDGIVAAADLLALGLLQSFADSEIRVPQDIAIIGHDNNRAAWDSIIPLSTIAQPGHDVGATATRLLIEEIRHPERHVHKKVILEPALIVRESTVGHR